MKKKIQTFKTDAKAEQFVDTADLSKYDLSGLKALKMKNPPHSGFSVRVDCLEPHGLSVTEGAKVLGVGVVKGSDPLNDSDACSEGQSRNRDGHRSTAPVGPTQGKESHANLEG